MTDLKKRNGIDSKQILGMTLMKEEYFEHNNDDFSSGLCTRKDDFNLFWAKSIGIGPSIDLIQGGITTNLIYFWSRSILAGSVLVKVLFHGDSFFRPPSVLLL